MAVEATNIHQAGVYSAAIEALRSELGRTAAARNQFALHVEGDERSLANNRAALAAKEARIAELEAAIRALGGEI